MTSSRRSGPGLSVAEVVIAIALLAITFVSLLAVLAGGLRTDRKAYFKDAAASTARVLLTKSLGKVTQDLPPGTKAHFWSQDFPDRDAPYLKGEETSGDVTFRYEICTRAVMSTAGVPFGSPNHRLKQVDIYVSWTSDDERTGYGSTVYRDRRILSEASGDPL